MALREWLPLLFDRVAPWASDTDIAAGQRGLAQIESELENTRFGIVVVTSANQHAPWLNFEAGALSKTVGGDVEQRVVPLLVDLAGPTQLTGPLAQFQAKTAQQAGVLSMLRSLAAVAGIEESVATARFEAYWPQLAEKIETAKTNAARPQKQQTKRDEADVLDEILLHVRALRSDGESNPPRSLAGTPLKGNSSAKERYFHKFITELAASYDLTVSRYPDWRGGAKRDVVVSPRGAYSADAIERFTAELRERAAPGDQDVSVTAAPF